MTDKGKAVPVKRTPAQKAAATRAAKQQLERDNAVRLAQIVNLQIAGYSLAEIGIQIGATPEEVDRMLTQDATRYVRTQPALRTYVRNYISGKYTKLLDAVWEEATDKNNPKKLDNQDRALRILKEMQNLHGAAAPVQTEIKIETAPEAVEKLVTALSRAQGYGYDDDIFDHDDIVDADVVHDAVDEADGALEQASDAVEDGEDEAL